MAASFGVAVPGIARAQTYPNKAVKVVLPYTPGSPNDVVARVIAPVLSSRLGHPVVVDNRPGGGTTIGLKAVMQADPDGYTLLYSNTPTHVIAQLVAKGFTYDPIKDFTPVVTVGSTSLVLVAPPSAPPTLQEFIAYAKANPGKINLASSGIGTGPHMAGELFKMIAGVDIVHVPYRSAAAALTDLLSGQVQIMFPVPAAATEHIREGTLRPLAVGTATRWETLPDVPALGEFLPGFEASAWFGIVAPRNTPAGIVDKLNNEVNGALADPKIKARLANLGGTVLASSPTEFGNLIAEETKKWGEVIRTANIKPN